MTVGIFDREADLWVYHKATLEFDDKIMGGVPKDTKLIEGWLRTSGHVSDNAEEVREGIIKTLMEVGITGISDDMSYDDLVKASEKLAKEVKTTGFKVADGIGVYIEGRQIKAAIKENVNIQYASGRWGRTKKGPKNFVAERVFVVEDRVALGRAQPDGVDLVIGQIKGPQGPRSTVSYHEYVNRPTLTFHIMESKQIKVGDAKEVPYSLTRDQWAKVWASMQANGIGAMRSQGHGQFKITGWDEVGYDDLPVIGEDAKVTASANGRREVAV